MQLKTQKIYGFTKSDLAQEQRKNCSYVDGLSFEMIDANLPSDSDESIYILTDGEFHYQTLRGLISLAIGYTPPTEFLPNGFLALKIRFSEIQELQNIFDLIYVSTIDDALGAYRENSAENFAAKAKRPVGSRFRV